MPPPLLLNPGDGPETLMVDFTPSDTNSFASETLIVVFDLAHCVQTKRLFRTLFATSFHFILLARLNGPLRLYFVPERHARPTSYVTWLTFQLHNLVVAFFPERVTACERVGPRCGNTLFAFDTSRDSRKSDCPTNYFDGTTVRQISL